MQSNNWRVTKNDSVFASNGWVSFGVGTVRENACAPDEFFWASQHPFFELKGDKHDDIAVPHDVIGQIAGLKITLTITRDEFLALPQRWQIERDPEVGTHRQPPPTRSVRSAIEEGIHEMASIEKMRQELIAEYGTPSPEMEELFAAHRKQVRDRRLAQLERELSVMMGMEEMR